MVYRIVQINTRQQFWNKQHSFGLNYLVIHNRSITETSSSIFVPKYSYLVFGGIFKPCDIVYIVLSALTSTSGCLVMANIHGMVQRMVTWLHNYLFVVIVSIITFCINNIINLEWHKFDCDWKNDKQPIFFAKTGVASLQPVLINDSKWNDINF